MADYYSILKKTISGLAKNTPEIRNAVYTKARASIERQLRGINPPISEQAVASQLLSLEQAIATIDAEYSTIAATPPPATPDVAQPPVPPAPTQPTAPIQQSIAEPAYTPPAPPQASNPVMDVLSGSQPPAQTPPATPSVAEPPAQAPLANPSVAEPSVQPQIAEPLPEPAPPTQASVQTTAGALDAMSSAVQADTNRGPETVTLGPETDFERSHHDYSEKPKRGFGKFILVLVILALLGGGGYFAWQSKDQIMSFAENILGDNSGGNSESSITIQDSGANSSVDKEAVRIGQDGQDASADPVDENATSNEVTQVAPTTEPEVVQPDPETQDPVVDPVEENAQPQQPAAPQIGEVAYLYEEGSAGEGATRTNAGITWDVESQQVEQDRTAEPVIVGTMEIPEREMTLTIKIKRNVDEALSASHLIEMVFDVPDGFEGQGIEEVARFVMKPTEEARGEALVAVPVKVSDGFFLVALDNLPQAVEVNTQLMESSAWIDVPISYQTGKRALLTLEKGPSGVAAFKEALDDWRNR